MRNNPNARYCPRDLHSIQAVSSKRGYGFGESEGHASRCALERQNERRASAQDFPGVQEAVSDLRIARRIKSARNRDVYFHDRFVQIQGKGDSWLGADDYGGIRRKRPGSHGRSHPFAWRGEEDRELRLELRVRTRYDLCGYARIPNRAPAWLEQGKNAGAR